MKQSFFLLAILQLLSFVAAHPFVIVHTKTESYRHVPTHILPRQGGLLDQWASAINSALGISDPTTSTSSVKNSGKATPSPATPPAPATPSAVSTRTVQTLAPPVTASATSSSTNFRSGVLPVTSSTSSSTTLASSTSTTSSTSTDSSTSTSTSTTDSSTSTSTSTSSSTSTTSTSIATTSTSQPLPSPTLPLVQPTTSAVASSSDNDGNKVPKAGIAIAVIMIIIIACVAAWLVFRYNSRIQAWWTARQEKQRQERSYREALDGPNAGSPNLRQEALGADRSKRRTMLQSFFAPATVLLEPGKEIKRKPVNWGAKSPVSQNGQVDSEKVSIAASAAPMGHDEPPPPVPAMPVAVPPASIPETGGTRQIIAELDSTPILPPATVPLTQPVSPISIGRKESLRNLPPVSPLSPRTVMPTISETEARKDLPELPSISDSRKPNLPPQVLMARKGSDGVYRLG